MIKLNEVAISYGMIVLLSAYPAIAGGIEAAKADATVVEVAMTNQPDGRQIMTLSQNPVHAGPVLFKVMNHSPNSVHEFLVLRTDLDPEAFPMEDSGIRVDESKVSGIKELGDLDPGKSGQMPMTLSPGRYVLFCNQPGHFMAGMFATLTVTP